jgi:predicted metal-dependent hydrolase
MSKKSPRIAAFIEKRRGCAADAHYLGFFDAFNTGQYFEAHEVLEELWLTMRHEPGGDFHKGLIQLAGAFVHLQKSRPSPAAALFKLADGNLRKFGPFHEHLDVTRVLELIQQWQTRLQADGEMPALTDATAPNINPAASAFSPR